MALNTINQTNQKYIDCLRLYYVKEPSVTAHDEWSIRDLLHWQNYPSLPITFPCFECRGV